MLSLEVARTVDDELICVGAIKRAGRGMHESFAYHESYLERADACPLSSSLPLSQREYLAYEIRPYFEGLLPEGPTREALVGQLGLPQDDYLAILEAIGLDCIGDVVVVPSEEFDILSSSMWDEGSYEPLDEGDMRNVLSDLSSLAWSNGQSRLSLAGTQGKVGLAHIPDSPMEEGWLRPLGGAASTHILKTGNLSRIAEFEIICMQAARACGVTVASLDTLSFGRPVACVERFDRVISDGGNGLHVKRLHQEDLAQAFGVTSQAKYLELENGTCRRIARLIENHSLDPLKDIDTFARVSVFNYLVGNCDNHLKNLSVIYEGSHMRLAPAYDIVCTTFFERFSREMGMRLGSSRFIDYVRPADFELLAKDLGVGVRRMRRVCSDLVERLPDALLEAGEAGSDVIETLPYSAEDVLNDAESRLGVVSAFARGA